ncbi:S53 family peptidase [Tunturibacter empetritectus]|uniref:Kumamolisin n=1 Tax=Tunturiibacter lichenicola TaxID=2051959 RepID=A0A7W8N6X1_9BACT|nr:S53 family peptidase [Edaphobacter lichenicola]MBB5345440.1 kumamolisin [Edaphobacter lichenicola]
MATKKTSTPHIAASPRTTLPGSEKKLFRPSTAEPATEKPAPSSGKITVSVIVRRKAPLKAANRLGKQRLTRAQYKQSHAADPAAVKLVRAFAKEFSLTVVPDPLSLECRTIKLSGTMAAMQKAFGVTLTHTTYDGGTYRVRQGSITLPDELVGPVEAVLGLDNRPQAQPHFRIAGQHGDLAANAAQAGGFAHPHTVTPHAAATNIAYTPPQVAALYQFPPNASAAGQTIGLIELGGGYKTADLTAYFKTLNQKAPKVTTVSVDGGKNSPSTVNSADGEVMLDIEVAAAVAPGANIVVYFAPNTDQGFIDAVATAVHDTTNKPSVISISWGGPESSWTTQSLNSLDAACQSAAALGITITVAAGDNGSTDNVTDGQNHVDFPASSPHVLACGGTKLLGTGSTISSEVVWNELANNEGATGGGVSNFFPLPSWQANAGVPAPTTPGGGRGVPDVAGNADPSTGYTIRVDGQTLPIGGTSAVAPLWAGLIALANAQNGTSAGFLQPALYAAKGKAAFNDITSGTNYQGTPTGFTAGPGWDACTGLGSPIGTKVITVVNPSTGASKGGKNKGSKKKPVRTRPARKPHAVTNRRKAAAGKRR